MRFDWYDSISTKAISILLTYNKIYGSIGLYIFVDRHFRNNFFCYFFSWTSQNSN